MDQLDEFINDILKQKQLPGLTDEVRSNLVEEMRTSLLDQINRAVLDALPDDKLDEFEHMADSGSVSDEAMQQFLSQNVDIQQITAATMLRFRDLYLQGEAERRRE